MNKVIVLLSTFNGDRYLRQQIDSILGQEGVDVSIIIRDDGSTDNTIKILEEYANRSSAISILIGENCGSTASFSFLLKHACLKYGNDVFFSFADQDDVWLPKKLRTAIQYINVKSNIPMLYCSNLLCVDERLRFICKARKNIGGFIKSSTLIEPISTGCTMVFNKSAADLYVKSYYSDVRIHDIWMSQICAFLGQVYYDDNSYILYRNHGGNQIGAYVSKIERIRSKLESLKSLKEQHVRENDAKTFLGQFCDSLSGEDYEMINVVSNYRKRLVLRLKFYKYIFTGKCKRHISSNFWLLMRVTLGKV